MTTPTAVGLLAVETAVRLPLHALLSKPQCSAVLVLRTSCFRQHKTWDRPCIPAFPA